LGWLRAAACLAFVATGVAGCHDTSARDTRVDAHVAAFDSGAGGTSDAPLGSAGAPDGAGHGGVDAVPAPVDAGAGLVLLAARIRRLANAEYDASLKRLLGTSQAPAVGADFPPDLRQNGFTVNDAQRIDAVVVERLASAADELTNEARQNGTLARLAPCDGSADKRACAKSFVGTFGPKVYRRPLLDDEVSSLLALYDAGAEGASYEDGIDQTVRGLLQSAGFLYLTELGSAVEPATGPFTLTPYEIASSISYLVTAAPPDDALLAKAVAGALDDPDEREAQVRRLFKQDDLAADNTVRMVREWLGIDLIDGTAKDSVVYPAFAAEKPKIVSESKDFVKAVLFRGKGTVAELLGADWTVDSGPLDMYGTGDAGPLTGTTHVTDRVGILNQAAFLARYANAHESHPVFRGVAIARRVACIHIDSPSSFLNIMVVPPAPDPSMTTRERFDVHAQDPVCQLCHKTIDGFGFSFEKYDGMGAFRTQENGKPVDSTVTVADDMDFDGAYQDSNQLATALAQSEPVRECLARFMFRAAVGNSSSSLDDYEDSFVTYWKSIPKAAQGNVLETLIAYVRLPTFTQRRPQE
jgi:hypothetical protein